MNRIMILVDFIIYIIQILLMVSFSRYIHSNYLYKYFIFSLIFNFLLIWINQDKKNVKIILANILFAFTVYYFANKNLLINKNFINVVKSCLFNIFIFLFFAGNLMVFFISKRLSLILNAYKNRNDET